MNTEGGILSLHSEGEYQIMLAHKDFWYNEWKGAQDLKNAETRNANSLFAKTLELKKQLMEAHKELGEVRQALMEYEEVRTVPYGLPVNEPLDVCVDHDVCQDQGVEDLPPCESPSTIKKCQGEEGLDSLDSNLTVVWERDPDTITASTPFDEDGMASITIDVPMGTLIVTAS
jgi:hypothetical protein